jgi:TonB family protein
VANRATDRQCCIITKSEGTMRTFMKIVAAFAIFSLCRPVAAEEQMQRWLPKNGIVLLGEGSPLFYVNKEDQGKILIILGEQIYLLETKYPSVVRVTNTLPKANGELETGEIKTEPLKDMTAIVQNIPGTPTFAGSMYSMGWSVCFQENVKPDPGHMPRCYMFVHYDGGSPSKAAALPPIIKRVQREPIKVGGNVLQSKLIRKVDPVYPEEARSVQLSGKVILSVTVDEEGNVSDIKATNGHPLLDKAATAAVSQWKYSPTLLNGEPVPVITTVTVIFSCTASGETAISVGD